MIPLRTSLFQLVCFHIFAVLAPCSAAQNAITTVAVTLEILHNGKQAGSTTIAAGRAVQVIEEEEERVKISIPPVASGWVDRKAVEMHEADELKFAAVSGEMDEGPVAPASNTAQRGPASAYAGGGYKTRTSRILIVEGHESKNVAPAPPSKCRGSEETFIFLPKITRGQDLEGKEVKLRFYIIALQENKEKTASSSVLRRVVINGHSFADKKIVYEPTVQAMKELPVSKGEETLGPITHEQMEWQCRCCKDLRHGEYVGWYAELVAEDKIVYRTQSGMDPRAANALQSYLAEVAP